MSNKLFNDFESVSDKQWKQKIQADLKGADYNDTLIFKTNEGIDVKPFYHQDEFSDLPNMSSTKATEWEIGQYIQVINAAEANKKAIDAINRGAESIGFVIVDSDISISELLKNISTPIYLKTEFLSEEFITNALNLNLKQINFDTDIIGNLAKTGNWYTNLKSDHSAFEAVVKATKQFTINASLYQNAGANIVQELAYALAHCNEYLNHFDGILNKDEKLQLKITYKVAVGTNYFFEIAKLRALRKLHQTLATEYNVNANCKIIATPTKRNKTLYDYNTNMLRTTTECMSAVLGGANTIFNLPYDAIYHNDNEFGERISRNQLLVLKHESYFDKVNNPADGAYYIESLTEQFSEKALEIFKTIENVGGFLHQLKEGTIQRKIKESANQEQEQFNDETLILLGTNKHPNPNDKMKHELERDPFVQHNKRKTLIEPIIKKRLAEALEQERLKTEN